MWTDVQTSFLGTRFSSHDKSDGTKHAPTGTCTDEEVLWQDPACVFVSKVPVLVCLVSQLRLMMVTMCVSAS